MLLRPIPCQSGEKISHMVPKQGVGVEPKRGVGVARMTETILGKLWGRVGILDTETPIAPRNWVGGGAGGVGRGWQGRHGVGVAAAAGR